jgi:hypothetical protein
MLGPLEYIVIGFAGNTFDGSIAREIERVVENGTIRLVDVVFVGKDADGQAIVLGDRKALLTPEDLEQVAADLPVDTSGLVMLFEHRWAEHIKEAMAGAGGFVVGRAVIPPEVLAALSDELEAHVATVAVPAA